MAVDGGRITVTVLAEGYIRPITINVNGISRELHGGDSATFDSTRRSGSDGRVARGEQKGFEGAIFDVDGVLVDSPHERG